MAIQVTMMLASLGMPSVITRQALMTENGVPRARSLFVRACLLTLALGACAAAVAAVATHGQDTNHQLTWVFALLAGTGFVVTENGQALLRATDRPMAFISISAVSMLGGPLLGLTALLALGRNPACYIGGLAAGYLLAGAVAWAVCLGTRFTAERRFEAGDMRIAFRLGLPILPHMVSLYLLSMSLVLISASRYGVGASGRIQLALLVGTAPNVITSSLNNSWAPTVYATPEAQRGTVVEHTAADIAWLTGLVSAGVALLSPWLLQIFASRAFDPIELVPAACLVVLGSMLSIAYLANVQLVFASGRPGRLSIVTPTSLIIGVVAALLLGRISLTAIAAGFPIAYVALATGVGMLRRHVDAPHWSELKLIKPLAVGGALIAVGAIWPTSGMVVWFRWPIAAAAGVLLLLNVRRVFRPSA